MSIGDKAKNKAEQATGQAKETTGKATGNDDLKAEGKADQADAHTKQAGEKVKDAAKEVKDGFKSDRSSGRGSLLGGGRALACRLRAGRVEPCDGLERSRRPRKETDARLAASHARRDGAA